MLIKTKLHATRNIVGNITIYDRIHDHHIKRNVNDKKENID